MASASSLSRSISFLSVTFSSSLDLSTAGTDSKGDLVPVMEFQSIFSRSIAGAAPERGKA